MAISHSEQLTPEQRGVVDVVVETIESTVEHMTDGEAERLFSQLAKMKNKFNTEIYLLLQWNNTEERDSIDEICLRMEKDEQVRTGVLIKLNQKGLINRRKKRKNFEKEKLERIEFARKVHLYIREVFEVITFEQKWEFIDVITLFKEEFDFEALRNLLKKAEGVKESHKEGIIGCLLDGKSRTELIKIMVEEGIT